jgi:hypothetical protein
VSSEQISFVYKRPPITLVLTVLLTSVLSCFISLFVAIAYVGWFEATVGIQPYIVFLVVLMAIFVWMTIKSISGWFWFLSIDENQISLKPFVGHRITLNRGDIQKFDWDDKKVRFSTVSDTLEFQYNSLPSKSKIEFFDLVPTWLPLKALPPEMQTRIKDVEKQVDEIPPNLDKPVRASGSLRHTFQDPGHVIVMIMILFAVVSVPYGVLSVFGFGMISLITILVCIVFAGAVTWSVLNKYVEISDKGIEYQVGFRKRFFVWDDIDTIAIEPRLGQIIVWVNGKYSRIPLVGLNRQQLTSLMQTFSEQSYVRKIPFGYA